MAVKFQLRRDTAANWSSTNPVLSQGEPGWDLTNNILKIGDGATAWNSLSTTDYGDYLASGISYDNTSSGLTATQVQAAIDELNNRIPADSSLANPAITVVSSANELTAIDVQITNFDVLATYSFTVTGGTVSGTYPYTWTLPEVSSDTDHTLTIQSSKTGFSPSSVVSAVVSVVNAGVTTSADDTFTFTDLSERMRIRVSS